MNSVMLIGRLTRDPDVRYTAGSQMAVARFSLAIDDGYGEKKRTDFPTIVVFGKQAENCEKYLAKGSQVGVQGKLQTGSYQNKDGNTVYTTDVVANRVEFLSGGSGNSMRNSTPERNTSSQDSISAEMPDSFQAIDEDVPF